MTITNHLPSAHEAVCITYHCDEQAKLRIQVHNISICKHEGAFVLLARHKNDVDLLSSNRKNGQVYPVELIKAAPRAGLRKT